MSNPTATECLHHFLDNFYHYTVSYLGQGIQDREEEIERLCDEYNLDNREVKKYLENKRRSR